jgi:cytochrome P450
MAATTANAPLPKASIRDTLGVIADVVTPNLAKGVILRRPRVVAMAQWMDLDRRAVKRMQQLRDKYGTGPLMLRLPVRNQAVILDPTHVRQVLDHSPDPFSTASSEKRAALSHFEPKGALITPPGPERRDRRRFNEQVLQSDNPMHRLAERFASVVDEEAGHLLDAVRRGGGELVWDEFIEAWFRAVRRVVFGDSARDDEELRELINELRSDGNWAFLKPKREHLRERFFERLNAHLARAEPGSLAAVIASVPKSRSTAPDHQVPQWLFAFDPAGMTTFRALALLASHPEQTERAREEIRSHGAPTTHLLPFLRACILESLRLWPTTPMVLRQTTEETRWESGVMPEKTGVMIFAPFFHRDDQRLPYANRFSPELWLEEGKEDQARPPMDWPLIPFSGGPAICPGRNVVLLLTSNMLAAVLGERQIRLVSEPKLQPGQLPGTLNNYGLRFRLDG